MNRRIEGAFREYAHLLEAIEDLRNSGYETSQLLVVTRNDLNTSLTDKTGVEVVVTRGESLWDKIVSFFTVDLDGDDEETEDEEDLFEKFGIDEETYERFEESLENGEYLLLVDTNPPADPSAHADFMVRDGIIKANEEARLSARPDWTAEDEVDGDVPKHARTAALTGEAAKDSLAAEVRGVDKVNEEASFAETEPPVLKEGMTKDDLAPEVRGVYPNEEPLEVASAPEELIPQSPVPEVERELQETPPAAEVRGVNTLDAEADIEKSAPKYSGEAVVDSSVAEVRGVTGYSDSKSEEEAAFDELKHDEISFPDVDKVSTDPFGGETENKEQ